MHAKRVKHDDLKPDLERLGHDLEAISAFTEPGHDGWTRRVLSDPYLASRAFVRQTMVEAGLEVHTDAAGNTIGILEGRTHGSAIASGSHTDTVASGGRYDGVVGVMGAIETARRFQETGTRLDHDFYVIDFLGEEPNDYGVSCVGSRVITGAVTPEFFDKSSAEGVSLGQEFERLGFSPAAMLDAAWPTGRLAGFVELHIEQGPVLERSGTQLGVVTTIAGIERVLATFLGRPDHAGTAAMADRKDALVAAAEAILMVEQIGCSGEHSVATVGSIDVEPGALNVVPSLSRLWTELRSPSAEWLGTARRRLLSEFTDLADRRGIQVDLEWLNDQDPVHTAQTVQDLIAGTSDSLGYSWRAMPSGAGHDAAHIATVTPTGMIFVPSRGGRSHCPEEFTELADIGIGVHALAATLLELDAR
ncbi:M20 family metallo-hydrolase [Subtercola frigoramans]|uniref:N-carbamoyl-L-amino-acid hydrolase n=1 Tax=Subtercola frigoramans TaxID=120298 RepID=A0ABS2L8S2_9MICO|nr:M20 family metallo-hydrolase [Subtercola frigoramans]MBM7473474.1 N-carbamoyl-L-amino-acid hydrolase [Subtercola frigoramans]